MAEEFLEGFDPEEYVNIGDYHEVVRYGIIIFGWVTRITERFANQTIIDPIGITEFDRILGYSGGNVAITIHGFLRGPNKKKEKNLLEFSRNIQAFLAHIPGDLADVGVGQIALYAWLSYAGTFYSDMCLQSFMAITEMTFEQTPQFGGEFAYTITFEKLSWGLFQYLIDIVISLIGGVLTTEILPNEISTLCGPNDITNLLSESFGEIGTTKTISEVVSETSLDIINDNITDTEYVGQIVQVISDPADMFPNIPYVKNYRVEVDKNITYYRIPFSQTFPQDFSFNMSGNFYRSKWSIISIRSEEEVISYYLRLELYKNSVLIYAGKIPTKIEYVFDEISLYISSFEVTATLDGIPNHRIYGMIGAISKTRTETNTIPDTTPVIPP